MQHGVMDECPMCGEPKLGRNGATMRHIAECLPEYTSLSVEIDLEALWTDPVDAAAKVALATALVANTERGREIAANLQQQRQQHQRHRSKSAGNNKKPVRRAAGQQQRGG